MEHKSRAELLLDGLKLRIEEAPSATFNSEKVVLDKNEMRNLIDKVSDIVMEELKEYQEINDKRARILKEAQEQADEILYQAEKSASRIRVTKRRKGEPPAFKNSELSDDEKRALRDANDIYASSLIYVDEMLTEVDHVMMDAYSKIEQEYDRMHKTLKSRLDEISDNRTEITQNLNELSVQDRYSQILELSALLSNELYNEREKARLLAKEESSQLSISFDDDIPGSNDKKERPEINTDRTEVKIKSRETLEPEIKVMDRSQEAVGRRDA